MVYDCIIIGSGVAGLTAALYLRRANKSVLIIEDAVIGGTTANLDIVENYPGFLKISGNELIQNMIMQVSNIGANISIMTINSIDFDNNVLIADNNSFNYKTLIIASGMSFNKLNIENESNYRYKGLSYCAVCDGALYKNKKIVVAINGNCGIDTINYLKNITDDITIIDINSQFRDENFKVYSNSRIVKINGLSKIDSLDILVNNEIKTIECDGLFVSLGKSTNTQLYAGKINLKNGFIIGDENMHTNIENVFVAGDIRYKTLRQIITACSDGAIAASEAIKYIQK